VFTGIVEELGRIASARHRDGGLELEVEGPGICADLAWGDSVNINGACQTITRLEGSRFNVFAMGETLRTTTLGELAEGSLVNLERALTPSSRLGGHFVSGHVDGVARIADLRDETSWRTLRLEMATSLAEMLVPKGSLAVDGISLTAGPEIFSDGCEIYIIPHTLSTTTLSRVRAGDRVNLETDILGKYVLRYMQRGENRDQNLLGLLIEQGFMNEDEG
jgi:riboflavin synthase